MTQSRFKTKIIVMFLAFVVGAIGQPANPAGANVAPDANLPAPADGNFPLSAYAAMGSSFIQSSRLSELDWSEEQVTAFLDGIRASFQGKGYAVDETIQRMIGVMTERLREIEKRKQHEAVAKLAEPGQMAQYMKTMRKRLGLQLSDSGLAYSIVSGQQGIRPRLGDTVVVSCDARAADATTKLPQLSNDHVRVKLEALLPGFMEAFQMMTIDSTAILLLPPELSFGTGEWPKGMERGQPLMFRVTLHDVISAESKR